MKPNLEAMDASIRNIHVYFLLKDWSKVLTELVWLKEHLDAIENVVLNNVEEIK